MVDYREWIGKALVFLDEARDDVSRGRYWLACFHAQQYAELLLKAVIIKLTGSYPFTHSLVELLEAIEDLDYRVDENLYIVAEALEKHYTLARYPGTRIVVYDSRVAGRCLTHAERIGELARSILEEAEGEAG